MKRGRSWAFLATGTAFFAASFAVVKKLVELGEVEFPDGHNPISFCNVLFVGNLIAGVAFALFFQKDLRPQTFRSIRPVNWGQLLVIAFLEGALAPTLIFVALSEIPVASVVLIQSIKIPLILLLAWWLQRETTSAPAALGAGLGVVGIALMMILKPTSEATAGGLWGVSEGKVALASVFFVLATQLRRMMGTTIPLGIYFLARTVAGGIFFAIIVLNAFGPSHFMDVFDPFLWKWMLIYGLVIVAVGQIAWQLALRSVGAAEISASEAATPVLGILFAYLLLGQAPTQAEILGGVVVVGGMMLSLWGTVRSSPTSTPPAALPKPGPFTGI
ncbi:MAG: DMT family transporter [Verrucomicrobiota bacterium]